MSRLRTILVTGGAGYIGARLVPKLLASGHQVRVLDKLLYGNGLASLGGHDRLAVIRGDIRHEATVRGALTGADTVFHLAAVANDPSFDLHPALSRSINYECLPFLFHTAKLEGVTRFIYASSASVYGVSDSPIVDEKHPLVPLTDYNRYKAAGERLLFAESVPDFETIAVRSATVCGSSARQRLDLTVNILTIQALCRGKISVFGGGQYRPNIHIADISRFYTLLANIDSLGGLCGHAVNVGGENRTVAEIATEVKSIVEQYHLASVAVDTTPTDDKRSYRLSSTLAARYLGFTPVFTISDAVKELCEDWSRGRYADVNPLDDPQFHNVKKLAATDLATR